MFPQGFLGTRADLLMDIVIVALLAVVPIVLYNWSLARRGDYARHKLLQVGLAVLLAAVVGLFEFNLRMQDGKHQPCSRGQTTKSQLLKKEVGRRFLPARSLFMAYRNRAN